MSPEDDALMAALDAVKDAAKTGATSENARERGLSGMNGLNVMDHLRNLVHLSHADCADLLPPIDHSMRQAHVEETSAKRGIEAMNCLKAIDKLRLAIASKKIAAALGSGRTIGNFDLWNMS